MAADRIVPGDEADPPVPRHHQLPHQGDDPRHFVGVDRVHQGIGIAFEHGDGRELFGDQVDGGFGKRIDQQDSAPVAVADMAEDRLPSGFGMKIARCLVVDIHADPLPLGGFTDPFQHVGESRHLNVTLGYADEDADRHGPARLGAADSTAGRLAVSQLLGHHLHPGAGFRADRRMIGQAARHRGARDIQPFGNQGLVESFHVNAAAVIPGDQLESRLLRGVKRGVFALS